MLLPNISNKEVYQLSLPLGVYTISQANAICLQKNRCANIFYFPTFLSPESILLKNSKMVHEALMLSQNASLIFFQYELIREKSKKPQIMQTFPL